MTLQPSQTRVGEDIKEQLTLFAGDSPAKRSALQENEKDLMTFAGQCSSILPTRLNKSNHAILSLKTSKVYSITTKGELSEQSSMRWMNSGMMSNGICITAKTTEFPKTESVSILSDILEDTVDEKYYLSDEKTEQLLARVSDTAETKKVIDDQGRLKKQLRLLDTVPTLRANTHGNESKVVEPKILRVIDGKKELGYSSQDVYSTDGLCNTLNTMSGGGREPKILIKEATKKGYAEASVGDSVNYSITTSKTRRGRVGKGVANTLDTGCQQGGVVPAAVIKEAKSIVVKTRGNIAFDIKCQYNGDLRAFRMDNKKSGIQELQVNNENNISHTITVNHAPKVYGASTNLRIRKLTPLECWRLQGFPDELFYKAQAVNSNSQLYKQAGNSVTVNVVYEVAKHLGGKGN